MKMISPFGMALGRGSWSHRICLAGNGWTQVENPGFAQTEQPLQERTRRAELLPTGLQDANEHTLAVCTPRGTIAAPHLTGYYHGTNGLFGPIIGSFQSGTVQEGEHRIPLPAQMAGQAAIGGGTSR